MFGRKLMNKLISIIVPIYNIEEYLSACIESLINQTYKEIEIILVDDGSTDKSASICDEYKERDARIVVIHKANGGLVSARKAGLDYAHGDYILNVDGDDWVDVRMCEVLIEKALKTNCDVVDASFVEERTDTLRKTHIYDESYYDLSDKCVACKLLMDWFYSPFGPSIHSTIWSKLFVKEVFEEVYSNVPDSMSYGEDMIAFVYLLSRGQSMYVVSEPLYYYRIRESSISHRTTDEVFRMSNVLDEYLYDTILNLFSNVDREVLDKWYINRKRLAINNHDYADDVICRVVYQLPDVDKIRGNIILYGAGKVGNDYYRQLAIYSEINIVAWVDKNAKEYQYDYCKISDISKCLSEQYDYVIIAVASKALSEEIKSELCSVGISESRIVWIEPIKKRIRLMIGDAN